MKPILFNGAMVRAILDGRKTVTRRTVRFSEGQNPHWTGYVPDGTVLYGSNNIPAAKAHYRPGNILYVRETFGYSAYAAWDGITYYRADADDKTERIVKAGSGWRPSIHMPKEAARIFLRVKDVRVERLQDITPKQIDAEGCKEYGYDVATGELVPSSPALFKVVWNSTIKPADLPLYGWDANPWVWVIEFEQISREEALKK